VVLRCTKKMLDLLGGRSVTLSELPPPDDDWDRDTGGLRRSDINVLNHNLRRMSWNRGDHVRPIEFVNKRHSART